MVLVHFNTFDDGDDSSDCDVSLSGSALKAAKKINLHWYL